MDWTTFNSIVIASARAQGPGPAPDTASEVTRAFWLIGGVSVLLLVGITVAMIWFAVRFRRGRARTTRQIKGHALLELAWIIIPTLIVIWMFSVGYKGFVFMRTIPPDARVIEVTAQQWSWSFRYPDHGVTSTEMYVPAGVPIHVKLQSVDVIHSFYIPELRVKEDAVPGRTTEMWFRADRVGDYNIFCAEFCGKDHAKMLAVLHVVEPEQYDRWLRERVARQYRPVTWEAYADPQAPGFEKMGVDAGALYANYCASCHGAAGDGSGLPGDARDFTSPEGWRKGRTVAGIYRTLVEGIPGTQMRAFPNLSPWQKLALAHYTRRFMADPPQPDREQYENLVAEYGLDKLKPPGPKLEIERAMELLVREGEGGPTTTAPTTAPDMPATRPDRQRTGETAPDR